MTEFKLSKKNSEQLAHAGFNKNVNALNKLEASGLIKELLNATAATPRTNLVARAHRRGPKDASA